MTQLTNTNPNVTYAGLLTCSVTGTGSTATAPGLTGSLQTVQDGLGNSSALQISTSAVNCTGTFNIGGNAITLAGSLITTGAYTTTFAQQGTYTITLPPYSSTLATIAGSETLTNKTLTTPVISTITNTGTLTLPTATTTLVGRSTTDTLTNKTLTSPIITTPMISTFNDGNGNTILTLNYDSVSAVNYIDIRNEATGTGPKINATGTDSNVGMSINTKGTGAITLNTGALTTPLVITSGTSGQHTTNFSFPNTSATKTITFSGTATISTTPITSVVKQTFTTNGTYTPTSGMVYCIIELVGAGGGGGGCSTSAGSSAAGGGGGAGAYAKRLFSATQVGASATITCSSSGGTGGTAGANTGTTGGSSSAALAGTGTITITAAGGAGGTGGSAGTSSSNGGAGGSSTNAEMATAGATGGNAMSLGTGEFAISGKGADGPWGGGGISTSSSNGNATGNNATGFGAGGSGGSGSQSASGSAGGNGAPGYILITEFIAA